MLPAVPALAMAAGPWLPELLRARGPRRLAFVLACAIAAVAALAAVYLAVAAGPARGTSPRCTASSPCCRSPALAACTAVALARVARPGRLARLRGRARRRCSRSPGIVVYPRIDAVRSGRAFMARVEQASAGIRELALVGAKEQYLLQLRRPSVNFGHARWRERESEADDAAAWLADGSRRAVLVMDKRSRELCFKDAQAVDLGRANQQHWFLVTGVPRSQPARRRGDRGGGPILRSARCGFKYRGLACIPYGVCQNAPQLTARQAN